MRLELGLPDLIVDRAQLEVRDELCTVPGRVHGGAIMAFADTLGAVGTALNLDAGAGTTTIESKTNFFSREAMRRLPALSRSACWRLVQRSNSRSGPSRCAMARASGVSAPSSSSCTPR